MKRLMIYAWHPRCPPALELANAIPNAWVIKHENSKYKKLPGDIVLNWGNGHHAVPHEVDLNKPGAVACAVHKVHTFKALEKAGVPCCEWTIYGAQAMKWGKRFLGRDSYTGRGGEGITVYEPGATPIQHKFYVKYFIKTREFRIHVLNGEAFWVQEKKKKLKEHGGGEDKYIRSHDRGWCFAFKHLDKEPCPELVKEVAIKAIKAVGLDFGAVDIGWNKNGKVCVFEINTAPGIENSTTVAYGKAFGKLLD